MKIYNLKVDDILQPKKQPFRYPSHNDDYSVEQDMLIYLQKNRHLLTDDPDLTDWHYLPVFWTRLYLNLDYARKEMDKVQKLVRQAIINDKKTFTVCQYDDGPIIDLKKTYILKCSGKINGGYFIPLLSKKLNIPFIKPKQQFIASFLGRNNTHEKRQIIRKKFNSYPNFLIKDGIFSLNDYIRSILSSYSVLCPRGYSVSTFRFYEVMQLGRVPVLVSDIDPRPFKEFINWDECSIYINSVDLIEATLNKYSKEKLVLMGKKAKEIYNKFLAYGKWCQFAVKKLESLS